MKFYFHPDAQAELARAVEYYEQFQPGLGFEFAEEVYAAITRIIQYPDAWSVLSRNSRRCLVSRFPYGVIYQIKSRSLRIIAIANLNRQPGYWKERLEQNETPNQDARKSRRGRRRLSGRRPSSAHVRQNKKRKVAFTSSSIPVKFTGARSLKRGISKQASAAEAASRRGSTLAFSRAGGRTYGHHLP